MIKQLPTREQVRAWLVWNEADGHFWWIRNPARRVRARRAGYALVKVTKTIWKIRVAGYDWPQDVIAKIFFGEPDAIKKPRAA